MCSPLLFLSRVRPNIFILKGDSDLANALTEQEFLSISDQALRKITHHMGLVRLFSQQSESSEDMCTVYTTFEGDYQGSLILCMDTEFLLHLAQQVLDANDVTPQDMEDTAKEFFNVLCGNVSAGLHQSAGLSTRFRIPQFRCGPVAPVPEPCRVLFYTSCRQEGLQLIHYPLPLLKAL